MQRVLLVDDEPDLLRNQVARLFPEAEIVVAHSGRYALEQIATHCPDIILLDIALPDFSGLELNARLRQIDGRIPVIFITGSATMDTAIEAMRQGAYDYLLKPIDLRQLDEAVRNALETARCMREPTMVGQSPMDEDAGEAIIGCCPAMLEVYKAIGRVADQKVMVLVTGESGTGKELVARAIYQHSERANAPFLAINCAAIPESLLESELFGHEKGAFTNAERRHIGKFEQCNGGTILLDEIGDMPLATQAKILRALQDQKFERVGGNQTIQTNVRIIAATHRDLNAWVVAGKFRPDLFYRLSVFTIHLPPLRERGNDLELLVRYCLRRCNRELGRAIRDVVPEAMEKLRAYSWPGNVRELQSVLKQALLRAHGSMLTLDLLPALEAREPISTVPGGKTTANLEAFIDRRLKAGATNLYAEALSEMDRVLIPSVLRYAGGNQVVAARILGIARQTLRKKAHDLDLNVGRMSPAHPALYEEDAE